MKFRYRKILVYSTDRKKVTDAGNNCQNTSKDAKYAPVYIYNIS